MAVKHPGFIGAQFSKKDEAVLVSVDELRQWLTSPVAGALPRHVGQRLDPDGDFLPLHGNTVIRHVTRPSATMDMLVAVQNRLKQSPYAGHFAFLPPSSFHMTVFEGVVDDRRRPDAWPNGMALDRPVAETTQLYLQRLAGVRAPAHMMRGLDVSPLGLLLEGATDSDERGMRVLREALTQPFGYRQDVHDSYRFHVTLAYVCRFLPDEAVTFYSDLCAELAETVRGFGPLELDRAAFCHFADLTHFEELLVL